MYKSLLLITLVVIIGAGLLVIGCSSSTTTTPVSTTPASTPAVTAVQTTAASAAPTAVKPKSGGTFTFVVDRSPAGNIGWPAATFTMVPQYMMYNSLVKAWWNGTITPELATSWDIDTKALSITFHLRKGVKFHDGTDFNATAVKFNFDPMIEAKKRADWKSVEVIDDYTVKVNLNVWRNTILQVFDGNCMVSPSAVQKNSIEWIKLHPVGTGPFTFGEFVQDDHMTLKKNTNYWDSGLPYVDTYKMIYVPDYVTRKAAMQKKDGDMMLVEFGKEAADFKAMSGINLFVQPQATAFMVMDDKNADSPFYNKKVREAVDYAIDRKWLADNLGFGYWQPCYQLPPRNNSAFIPSYTGRQFDLAKAKQLLTEAGFPNGFKTQLLPNPTALNKDIWVAIQSQLAKAGIDAELKFLEVAKFDEYRNTGAWKNAIVGDNLPSYGNMNQSLVQDFAPQAEFFQSLDKARPDWVEAITAASTTTDYDSKLTQKACQVLYDNVTAVPIAEGGRGYVFQPYVMDGNFGQRAAYFWAWDWEHFWLNK
jgi:peptide/nickel transport system substrate-binding protein